MCPRDFISLFLRIVLPTTTYHIETTCIAREVCSGKELNRAFVPPLLLLCVYLEGFHSVFPHKLE